MMKESISAIRMYYGASVIGVILAVLSFCGSLPAMVLESLGSVSHQIEVQHPGIEENTPHTYTLSQTLNDRGHPIGYSIEVDSVVCAEGYCKIVTVLMSWDVLGNYKSYAVAAGSFLEKALIPDENTTPKKNETEDASSEQDQGWTAFTEEDHAKLHQILGNPSSILKDQQLAELTGYRDKSRVDAMSGATPLTVKESVVQGAALSSYHLWHWANSEVVTIARELTHQNCSEEQLLEFITSDDSQYNLFALEHLRRYQPLSASIVPAVIEMMIRGQDSLLDSGLAYLRLAFPDEVDLYAVIYQLFEGLGSGARIHLLRVLEPELMHSAAKLDTLSVSLAKTDSYRELNLFLGLAEQHNEVSEHILKGAARFLRSDNFFMARRAYWFLEKRILNEQLTSQIEAFRDKCKNENRFLN